MQPIADDFRRAADEGRLSDARRHVKRLLDHLGRQSPTESVQHRAHTEAVVADVLERMRALELQCSPKVTETPPRTREHRRIVADLHDVAELMSLVSSIVDDQQRAVDRIADGTTHTERDLERSRAAIAQYERQNFEARPSLLLQGTLVCWLVSAAFIVLFWH